MDGDRLGPLLDAVHAALLRGDLQALPGLAEQIESALAALPAGDVVAARHLQDKARRNHPLLEAAARGLRAARQRLDEVRGAHGGRTCTYDGSGRRQMLAPEGRLAGRF